jgi:hypothetical protein
MYTLLAELVKHSLFSPLAQNMVGTNKFFNWYFYGMGGIGGWFIFLLIALVAVVWLLYDSGKRRLPALGWRLGVVLLLLLLLPTILYRFTVTPIHFQLYTVLHDTFKKTGDCPFDYLTVNFPDVQVTTCDDLLSSLPPLTPYGEWVFYLGLLGGVLAPVLAIGYWVTYHGMKGCPNGHVYEAAAGECPECNRLRAAQMPIQQQVPYMPYSPPAPRRPEPVVPSEPARPSRPKVSNAWLADVANNRRYDLYKGMTKIGRTSDNDLVINDPSISRSHAQIRESNGHFTLSDLDSKFGTYLNGTKLRTPMVLESGDVIVLGNTELKFLSAD